MVIENGLDLSERMHALYKKTPDVSELIANLCQKANYEKCERIYIGSSFCGRYFINMKKELIDKLLAYCKAEKIKVSVVIPVFTEKNLLNGKKKIADLNKQFGEVIDEVVVNDYGMLVYMHEHYKGKVNLAVGRLIMKDYRDPRYPEYFNTPYQPKTFTSYFEKMVDRYEVKAALCDATHREIDFSNKPEAVTIGIYEPYTYMTVGQICQLGSTHLPIEKKFRPNGPCQEECSDEKAEYFIEEGRKWFKLGRTIYFENRDFTVKGIDKLRRIHCVFDEEVEACAH